jgi:hypothetical protein
VFVEEENEQLTLDPPHSRAVNTRFDNLLLVYFILYFCYSYLLVNFIVCFAAQGIEFRTLCLLGGCSTS